MSLTTYIKYRFPQTLGFMAAVIATGIYFTSSIVDHSSYREALSAARIQADDNIRMRDEQNKIVQDLSGRNQELSKQLSELTKTVGTEKSPQELWTTAPGTS